jgi:3-isopropylmalate/(R)-2-methylmalate dehydratase large subunit
MPEGVYAKDVILSIIGRLSVNGATDKIIEFTGPVVDAMSMEARMTCCNMAVEAGATCGICLPDMAAVDAYQKLYPDPDAIYENIIDHDVSRLEPLVTFGYKPDQVKPVKEMGEIKIDQVYIGSCTNGFMDAGFCVTNPTCGACLGMSNGVLAEGEVCASTTNRNFNGRMGKGGMVHLMSPATAAASAITGYITNSNEFRD